jgi:hypothetical protein
MTEHGSPNDEYRGLMYMLAVFGRLTFVTTSLFAWLASAIALVAIAVSVILSIW